MNDSINLGRYEQDFSESNTDGSRPDREFNAKVEKITTGKTQNDNPKYTMVLRTMGGKYHGSISYKNNILSSPNSVAQFKRDLAVCNYYPKTLAEAFDNPEPLIGCHLRVKQVTRNGYTSIYFLELLSAADVESDSND